MSYYEKRYAPVKKYNMEEKQNKNKERDYALLSKFVKASSYFLFLEKRFFKVNSISNHLGLFLVSDNLHF